MSSDAELLQRYARDRDEAAFAELVRARIDLVHSAAARRVGGDPHLTKEITQEVFLSLARHAGQLARHPVLAAWLHTCTRNAAAYVLRRELRRARRQQEVQAMQDPDPTENIARIWESVRPELDAALDELAESDRQALVLRFFENESYPALGQRLGLREEAARMRVGRALEKLRTRLQRRGIASTAALLGGALSAHGVVGAPAGLAAAVSGAVTASAVVAPAFGFFYLMSTAKILATVAGLAAVTAAFVYYRHPGAPAVPVATVSAIVPSPPAPRPAPPPLPAAATAAASPSAEPARAPEPPAQKLTEEGAKVAALRDMLDRLPAQRIPELKLATEADWYNAVEGNALESDDDVRRALGRLRSAAEGRFARLVQPALRAFRDANAGQFPTDPIQLQSLVDAKVDLAMLQRYRVAPASESPRVSLGSPLILTQKSLIDEKYDHHSVIGPSGLGSWSASTMTRSSGDSGGGAPVSGGGGMGRGP